MNVEDNPSRFTMPHTNHTAETIVRAVGPRDPDEIVAVLSSIDFMLTRVAIDDRKRAALLRIVHRIESDPHQDGEP